MAHGGKRIGSGRPKGGGRWGESTLPIRVPASMADDVEAYLYAKGYKLPFLSSKVSAGTPSHISDDIEGYFTLNSLLIKNPDTTFLANASGDSMIDIGIFDGDTLVVDSSIVAMPGMIVFAYVDNQATVKRFKKDKSGVFLMPENKNYEPIKINKFNHLHIAGVVTGIVRRTL